MSRRSDRPSREGRIDLSCPQVLDSLKTAPPPSRLVPKKNVNTVSRLESVPLPEIYSPDTSWIRVSDNSNISYEVDADKIKGLIPIERPPTPPPVIDQEKVRQRKLEAFQKKYEKHKKTWREYQFDRQYFNSKIKSEGEKPSVILRSAHARPAQHINDVSSSSGRDDNIIWRNAISPTRRQQELSKPQGPDLIVPSIMKAYRRSDVTYTEHNVISSIKKARKAFPNTIDYRKDYTPIEKQLFMSAIAKELIPKPNFRRGVTGSGDFLKGGEGRSRPGKHMEIPTT